MKVQKKNSKEKQQGNQQGKTARKNCKEKQQKEKKRIRNLCIT